jgi:voltage-gated potassium channel
MFQDHYVILGWNISGIELIETLSSHSETGEIKIVLVNELDLEKTEELQQRFKNYDIQFLKGDYTGTAVLNRAKVAKAKAVLILPEGDAPPDTADEKTVLATLAVKSINPRIKTYVQVINRQAESHVERAGADRVIVPDRFTGFLLANCALQPSIPKLLEKLISYDKDVNLNVIKPPPSFVGDTFENYFLHLKREENRILIGFVAGESILSTEDILSDDISSVDAFSQQKLLQAGHSPEELETTSINLNPPLNYIIRSIDRAVIIGGI